MEHCYRAAHLRVLGVRKCVTVAAWTRLAYGANCLPLVTSPSQTCIVMQRFEQLGSRIEYFNAPQASHFGPAAPRPRWPQSFLEGRGLSHDLCHNPSTFFLLPYIHLLDLSYKLACEPKLATHSSKRVRTAAKHLLVDG